VKELLENALDAGALSIRVEAEAGGKRMIRVIDDGCGMTHDDALLAFERHSTSKLRTADDLLSIATLGFRGEALPSVAAVSRLLLETRADEDEQGTRVEMAGGKMIGVKAVGGPAGTSVRAAITEPELEPEERGADLGVRGFVSRPEAQRPNRNSIYIFVNKRLVRDRLILHAIHEAYRNIMPPNVFPAVLLFLEVPYQEV